MPKVIGLPKPRFNLDLKGNEAYIDLVFRYNGQRLKMPTGERVAPALWDEKNQRVKPDRKFGTDHAKTNQTLDELAAMVVAAYRESNFGQITPQDLKQEVLYRMGWEARPDRNTAVPSLFEFIENEYLPEKKAQPRGTWKILQTVLFLLKQYATEKTGGRLEYGNIDHRFFSHFKTWLFAAPREHSINYAAKVVNVVKQFMREAERRNYHSKTDYQSFSIKAVKTAKLALSFDELEALYLLDLTDNKRLENVRDLFLIGAYTGLRFSDFTRIRPENLTKDGDREVLTITTQKTGEPVSIPLMPIPAALLRKYGFHTSKISNQKMNEYLKELGRFAGLTDNMIYTQTTGGKRRETTGKKWERLTTHVARRSFATNFYKAGFPAVKLMKITGHATERQFMQYIAIGGMENALDLADEMKAKTTFRKIS